LVAAGVDVVGLDVDLAMLTHGRRGPFPLPRLIAADMRRFALYQSFAAVIIPYNSLQLLTKPADVSACLGCVRAHLAPRGLFGVEVTDFQTGAVQPEVEDQVIATGMFDGAPLTLSGSLRHDFAGRVSQYHRRFVTDRWQVTDVVAIRSYGPDELGSVLEAASFTVNQRIDAGPTTRVLAGVN
jgi:hypothetical protein